VRLLERHRFSKKGPSRERLFAHRGAHRLDVVPGDVDTEPDLGKADRARPRGREAEVCGAREQRPSGDGVARQRRDEGLAKQEEVEEERVEHADEPAEFLGAGVCQLPEVEAAAENLRGAGRQDDAADGRVFLGVQRGLVQRRHELGRQGVRLAAREREDPDAASVLHEKVVRGVDGDGAGRGDSAHAGDFLTRRPARRETPRAPGGRMSVRDGTSPR